MTTLLSDVSNGPPFPLVADGHAVYGPFAAHGWQLAAVPLELGAPLPLPGTHPGLQGYSPSAALDDEWIYWGAREETSGELFRSCKW